MQILISNAIIVLYSMQKIVTIQYKIYIITLNLIYKFKIIYRLRKKR